MISCPKIQPHHPCALKYSADMLECSSRVYITPSGVEFPKSFGTFQNKHPGKGEFLDSAPSTSSQVYATRVASRSVGHAAHYGWTDRNRSGNRFGSRVYVRTIENLRPTRPVGLREPGHSVPPERRRPIRPNLVQGLQGHDDDHQSQLGGRSGDWQVEVWDEGRHWPQCRPRKGNGTGGLLQAKSGHSNTNIRVTSLHGRGRPAELQPVPGQLHTGADPAWRINDPVSQRW